MLKFCDVPNVSQFISTSFDQQFDKMLVWVGIQNSIIMNNHLNLDY